MQGLKRQQALKGWILHDGRGRLKRPISNVLQQSRCHCADADDVNRHFNLRPRPSHTHGKVLQSISLSPMSDNVRSNVRNNFPSFFPTEAHSLSVPVHPEFLALRHESRILWHSYNPLCGFSMMEQVRLCAVCIDFSLDNSQVADHIQTFVQPLSDNPTLVL